MKIHQVRIRNFRNFKNLDVMLGEHAVIVGENKVGKTNFLFALRLILDPSLPDSARQLQDTDFWDGLQRPLTANDVISISVDLIDFEDSEDAKAVLCGHIVSPVPMLARLTYLFRMLPPRDGNPDGVPNYEFLIYGGDRTDNHFRSDARRWIPLDVLPALRDAEGDLATVRRSPLQPLLTRAASKIDRQELQKIADEVGALTQAVVTNNEISDLANQIGSRLCHMIGHSHAVDTTLGFVPTNPDRLLRAIRLLIDGGRRGIGDASLGTANLIFIALKSLELQQLVAQGSRTHTFLGIEEPEAHLHPHLQRLAYRDFLRQRSHYPENEKAAETENQTILLTTHSPHIVSVAPLRSIVLLRYLPGQQCTEAVSTAQVRFTDREIDDLERYIDVTRGEILFARGVILVEGEAEEFLIPTISKLLGYNLDELGITVCSVAGINFTPYVKLLGDDGLRLPFAILTDFDLKEDGTSLGMARVHKLLKEMLPEEEVQEVNEGERLGRAEELGIFLNSSTLEIDLFMCGCHQSMCETIKELTEIGAARARADAWRNDPDSLDKSKFLNDIKDIGKGRFAQCLASHIERDGCPCPDYIRKAILYVVEKCS